MTKLSGQALITIVVPVYNRSGIVQRTLESIAAQSLRPLDVVLVDNNSSDNTLQVLEQWAGEHRSEDFRITVCCQSTAGAAAARNRGLKEVNTPYVLFFDSDDTMLPDHAADFAAAFMANPQLDIIGRDVEAILPDGSHKILPFFEHNAQWNNIMHGGLSTQRYAVRTDLVRLVGTWDESVLAWDDIELGARLLMASPKVLRLDAAPAVTVFYQEQSITGPSFSANALRLEHALDCIERTLAGTPWQTYATIRGAHLAGLYRREKALMQSRALMEKVLDKEKNIFRRVLLRAVCLWTAAGLPGALRFPGLQ